MVVEIEDQEGIIKGPHLYLLKRYPLEKLETEVYELLERNGPMSLSAIWRSFDCHLWEICAALGRLRDKGLIEEKTLSNDT